MAACGLEALPDRRRSEDHDQQSGHHERLYEWREEDETGGSRGAGEVVAADRPRHPQAEQGVAEEGDGDAATERDGAGGPEVIRGVADELLAADGEADDPRDDHVVDIGVGVAGEDRPLRTRSSTESTLSRGRDHVEVRPPQQHGQHERERDCDRHRTLRVRPGPDAARDDRLSDRDDHEEREPLREVRRPHRELRDPPHERAADVERERDEEKRKPPLSGQPRKCEQRGGTEHEHGRDRQHVPPHGRCIAGAIGVQHDMQHAYDEVRGDKQQHFAVERVRDRERNQEARACRCEYAAANDPVVDAHVVGQPREADPGVPDRREHDAGAREPFRRGIRADEMRHLRDGVDEDEVEQKLDRCRPLLADGNPRFGVYRPRWRPSEQRHEGQLDAPAAAERPKRGIEQAPPRRHHRPANADAFAPRSARGRRPHNPSPWAACRGRRSSRLYWNLAAWLVCAGAPGRSLGDVMHVHSSRRRRRLVLIASGLATAGLVLASAAWARLPQTASASSPSGASSAVSPARTTMALKARRQTVTITPSRPADAAGWYRNPVTFTTTGTDSRGRPLACSAPQTYGGPDVSHLAIVGTCTDATGKIQSKTVDLRYDATAPTGPAAAGRPADQNGWYNAPVAVSFTGQDVTSGGVTCSPGRTYNGPDSADATIAGSCSDTAGNV